MSFEELGTLVMGTLFFPMGFVIVCATACHRCRAVDANRCKAVVRKLRENPCERWVQPGCIPTPVQSTVEGTRRGLHGQGSVTVTIDCTQFVGGRLHLDVKSIHRRPRNHRGRRRDHQWIGHTV